MESWDILKVNNRDLYSDDGLLLPPIGPWAVVKYENHKTYCSLFTSGMRNKWDKLVYIDMFSGAGKSKIRDTETILPGSPLLALNSSVPFDKYIFCETDSKILNVLESRTRSLFPDRSYTFLCGDSNEITDLILSEVPTPSKSLSVLAFCFIDPFNISQLKFETIKSISKIFVDFLIMIPSYMEINRFFSVFFKEEDHSIENFLGRPDWREEWDKRSLNPKMFGQFVLDLFWNKMESIGFICLSQTDRILVRFVEDKNQPLYHLGYFSRHERGLDFWRKTKDNTSKQMLLFRPDES